MIAQHVCIPMAEWCIDIYYDVMPRNADFILDKLEEMGCPERHLYKAEDLLKSGEPNEGLTYSSQRERRSLIVIGHATSIGEYISTIVHECNHLCDTISLYYGIPLGSEDNAYLMGDIAKTIYDNAIKHAVKIYKHYL